jgi:hypothetical protein
MNPARLARRFVFVDYTRGVGIKQAADKSWIRQMLRFGACNAIISNVNTPRPDNYYSGIERRLNPRVQTERGTTNGEHAH